MKNNICLGCRTYFEEGQKLPLQSMFIQFKNYYLPIKQSKQKWILLKTITGFLNSKGGTIFIGVEDHQGKVIGLQLSRKQQDQFLLFLKLFIESIKPEVDLVNKQQVTVMYVPVVTNKVFKGKYIIKILVKQGNPSKTYHFGQKLDLEFKGKSESFEIFHAFYRHNMGGIVQVKGEALLQQIARKAACPNEVSVTFHKFCNPQPLKLDGPITKIGFSGIRREQLRLKLQSIFHNKLQNFDVQYALTYDIENKVLLIELENEDQFRIINKYIKQNLKMLNQDQSFKFVEKGQNLDFYLYKNNAAYMESSQTQNKSGRQLSPPLPILSTEYSESKPKIQKKQFISSSQNQQATRINPAISSSQVWQFTSEDNCQKDSKKEKKRKIQQKNQSKNQPKTNQSNNNDEKIPQNQFVLTITHISIQKRQQLQQFLSKLLQNSTNVKLYKYVRTIQIQFEKRQDIIHFNDILQKNTKTLNSFGVHDNLIMGINMKRLRIGNYDVNKKKELRTYVQSKIGADLQKAQFKKSNNKFFLQCKFKTRQQTCNWLDRILSDVSMKQFMIPGSELGKFHKLKAYIHCICN